MKHLNISEMIGSFLKSILKGVDILKCKYWETILEIMSIYLKGIVLSKEDIRKP